MNTNNDIKPGDRVRLTGFSNPAHNSSYSGAAMHFAQSGHTFPCDAEFCDNGNVKGWLIGKDPELWYQIFTYEKIETDGNG